MDDGARGLGLWGGGGWRGGGGVARAPQIF